MDPVYELELAVLASAVGFERLLSMNFVAAIPPNFMSFSDMRLLRFSHPIGSDEDMVVSRWFLELSIAGLWLMLPFRVSTKEMENLSPQQRGVLLEVLLIFRFTSSLGLGLSLVEVTHSSYV